MSVLYHQLAAQAMAYCTARRLAVALAGWHTTGTQALLQRRLDGLGVLSVLLVSLSRWRQGCQAQRALRTSKAWFHTHHSYWVLRLTMSLW
jgi:hypothetical protein